MSKLLLSKYMKKFSELPMTSIKPESAFVQLAEKLPPQTYTIGGDIKTKLMLLKQEQPMTMPNITIVQDAGGGGGGFTPTEPQGFQIDTNLLLIGGLVLGAILLLRRKK